MHIAFSALQQQQNINSSPQQNLAANDHEPLLRFEAYQQTCQKYQDEIAAIQKYFPGWMPAFNR